VYPFAIFFFRQYAVTLPKDFLDAGRIDGVNEFGIYFRIMLPLMTPALGAMTILVSLQSWNDFLWPLIVMRTEKMFTLPIGLNALLTPYGNNYEMLLSGAFVATLPIVVVFLFFQRYFVSGLSAGAIKG
jgi:arabinosaccharide transport system permease protein